MRQFEFRFSGIVQPVRVRSKSGRWTIPVQACPYCGEHPEKDFAGDLVFLKEPGGADWPIGTWKYTCLSEGCVSDLEVEFVGKVTS